VSDQQQQLRLNALISEAALRHQMGGPKVMATSSTI
jgi:hypothetical protein